MSKKDGSTPNDDSIAERSDLRTLGLVLLNGFALMSYAAKTDPGHAANMLAGRTRYR